eukprot:SAG11_NODE_3260_length_2570_cov_54.796117_3_plen_261_part_00
MGSRGGPARPCGRRPDHEVARLVASRGAGSVARCAVLWLPLVSRGRITWWPPAWPPDRRPDHEVAWPAVLRGADSVACSGVPSLLLPPPTCARPRPSRLARRCLPRLACFGFASRVCVVWPGCCGCGLATRRRLPCRPRHPVASPLLALRRRSRPASCVVSWLVLVGSGSSLSPCRSGRPPPPLRRRALPRSAHWGVLGPPEPEPSVAMTLRRARARRARSGFGGARSGVGLPLSAPPLGGLPRPLPLGGGRPAPASLRL